ncbi:repulsive guidance molecule A-like [Limulus polyphemus]|uniref:Repulsive guidance molecule A-like n=1 Tax=Limulus polyphemus TaxID=6850 RepID=A0ABM1BN54_LIMPO|nr:repulsive guidance molecule A-like [Limulus polyphemus]
MGPRPHIGCPFHGIVSLTALFFLLLASTIHSAGGSHCKVELCSAQYQRATHSHIEFIRPGPSYHYCTVLRSYADCIRATARSCRGNLNYHSISSLVMQWFNDYNCTNVILNGMVTEQPPLTLRPHSSIPKACSFRGSHSGPVSFAHCGLFGDPHLRTFYDEFQTCRVQGAWPLIDNPYLAVQVTNEPVQDGSKATAIGKVTVIVRDHKPCTREKTFEAQSNILPGVFIDGSKGKPDDGSVFIWEVDPGSHVEIHIGHISTRIVIRRIGRYLTFAIKIPKEVSTLGANIDTLQLCVKGCPRRERIDYMQFLANPNYWVSKMTRNSRPAIPLQQAVELCRQRKVANFYFDACVFDILTTGDSSFSKAAERALEDAPIFGSGENRTYLSPDKDLSVPGTPENSAPGRPFNLLLTTTWFLVLTVKCMFK